MTAQDDGTFKIETEWEDCTLSELTSLYAESADDLDTAITNMGGVAGQMAERISVEFRTLINEQLIEPLQKLISSSNLDCRFLGAAWTGFTEGTCFELVSGLSLQADNIATLGFMSFILVFFLFWMWRYFLDNRTLWHRIHVELGEDVENDHRKDDEEWPEEDYDQDESEKSSNP